MLELVSQHLAPPLLVKQSSTLFKRLNAPAMFDAVVGKGLAGLYAVQEGPGASTGESGGLSASGVASGAPFSGRSAREECVAQDVEEGRSGAGGAGGQDGGRGKGCASWAEGADVTASADAPTCGSGCYAGDVLTDRSEYIQLQADIEQWVGEQRELPLGTPKGRPVAQQKASAKEPAVPEDIKRKLQRFAALKRKLAQAAFAHAGYLADPCLDGNGGADCPADGGRGWAGRPAALAEPGACGESASPSPPAPARAVELHGIPECLEGDAKHQPPADTPGGCPGPASPREAAAARAHAGRAAGLPPDSQPGLPQAVVVDTYAAAAVIDRAEASAGTAAQPSGCLPSKRVGSLDEQSGAPATETAAGEPIGEATGLGSSSEGDGDSSDRPEGAEDKCWICYEGGPIPWQARQPHAAREHALGYLLTPLMPTQAPGMQCYSSAVTAACAWAAQSVSSGKRGASAPCAGNPSLRCGLARPCPNPCDGCCLLPPPRVLGLPHPLPPSHPDALSSGADGTAPPRRCAGKRRAGVARHRARTARRAASRMVRRSWCGDRRGPMCYLGMKTGSIAGGVRGRD